MMVLIDYVVGADGGRYRAHNEFGDRRENVIGARTYFYSDEANCDANMENFIKGIDAVSGECVCVL